jgi:hypothetical protein
MESLQQIYEQKVLLEGKISNWMTNHLSTVKEAVLNWIEDNGGLKQVLAGGGGAAMIATSPLVMAAYFHKFFQQNPETLNYPVEFLESVANYIAHFLINNPKVLEFFTRN